MPLGVFPTLRKDALHFVLITYLVLCLVLGGAGRYGLFAHGTLQTIAALGIALLIVSWPRLLLLRGVKTPICIIVVLPLIGIVQCIPLPIGLWTALPGRAPIVEGYHALEIPLRDMPISLDPEATTQSLGYALSPLFVLLLSVRIGLRRLKRTIPGLMCVVGFFSVLMGLSQVYLGSESFLYLYENTNVGFPVGAFANVNHFSILLLMILPFAVFILRERSFKQSEIDQNIAWSATAICTLLLLAVGIGSAGSLAVYLMALPIVVLTWLGTRTRVQSKSANRLTGLAMLAVGAIAVMVVSTSPVLDGLGVTGAADNPTSRQNMWTYTWTAIDSFWPLGSGIGTYQSVIPMFEDPDLVTSRYIATAHNEYLQVLVEAGVLGLAVLLIGISWLFWRTKIVWLAGNAASSDNFQKMALVGILACSLHSIVDYPARTPAIASLLALYVAIVALPKIEHLRSEETKVPENPKRLVL